MTYSHRRDFLRSTVAIAAGGATLPYWCMGENARANQFKSKCDRPRIAAIGVGGRGSQITTEAAQFGDLVAICDVDLQHAEKLKVILGGKADIYQDYRRFLERKDIDVVINGTPDHWHTAINVAACKTGRDVYTEKPLTLTIDEGKLLCKVVEETGRIVQVGTLQRSQPEFQRGVELVRNGRIGKLRQVWVALPNQSMKGGPFAKRPIPSYFDWKLYQGQSPAHDYCPQRTHVTFRYWYEYSGGMITDWGNHHLDIAHWGMDCELTGPTSVEGRGLFSNPEGPGYYNTPDRFFVRMTYANGVELLLFSSLNDRYRYGDVEDFAKTSPEELDWLFGKDVPKEIKNYNRNGVMFIGDSGRVFVNRGGVFGKPAEELKENPLPLNAWRAYQSQNHMANFFDCVYTRKQPCSPVPIEHCVANVCHLANISIRLKRKLTWDPEKQQIVGDDEANAWQKREQHKGFGI